MASFSIKEYDYKSVTISVKDIEAGNTIRFIVRLEDDAADQTIFTSFVATGTSMTKTFGGLEHSTGYATNVDPGDGTGWIGAQYFTTEPPPPIWNGKVYRLPALDSSFALFNWSSWPNSYDALVPGGLTEYFEKDCWNAIVSKLSDALETAGASWDADYTTVSETLMSAPYDGLSAEMFNSVRYNIHKLIPLAWAWAKLPSFRGYVGREDFKGVAGVGEKAADDVYPEYFKELVRRLNLFIEILRETADLGYVSPRTQSLITDYDARGYARLAAVLSLGVYALESHYYAKLRKGWAVNSSYREALFTGYACDALARQRARIRVQGTYDTTSSSSCRMYAQRFLRITISADEHAASWGITRVTGSQGAPIKGIGSAQTGSDATVRGILPAYIEADAPSVSDSEATANTAQAVATEASEKSATDYGCKAASPKVTNVKAKGKNTTTIVVAALDTAWYPPEWVDGGLWIRQMHNPPLFIYEDTVLAEAKAKAASTTDYSATVGIGWIMPTLVEDGLWIRQANEATVADGILEVT